MKTTFTKTFDPGSTEDAYLKLKEEISINEVLMRSNGKLNGILAKAVSGFMKDNKKIMLKMARMIM